MVLRFGSWSLEFGTLWCDMGSDNSDSHEVVILSNHLDHPIDLLGGS